MRLPIITVAFLFGALAACASPEAMRSRGGAGADIGNKSKIVEMHEGSNPFYKTPRLIPTEYTSDGRRPADPASRK